MEHEQRLFAKTLMQDLEKPTGTVALQTQPQTLSKLTTQHMKRQKSRPHEAFGRSVVS